MAVEKLVCWKKSQIASPQDALQTIFSGRPGIFYPPKSRRFCGYRPFQHPQANALAEESAPIYGVTIRMNSHAVKDTLGICLRDKNTRTGQLVSSTPRYLIGPDRACCAQPFCHHY